MGSPITNSTSQKTASIDAYTGSNNRSSFTRGAKAVNMSATTGFDSLQTRTTGANSQRYERGSSIPQKDIQSIPNWMAFVDSNSKAANTAKKDF